MFKDNFPIDEETIDTLSGDGDFDSSTRVEPVDDEEEGNGAFTTVPTTHTYDLPNVVHGTSSIDVTGRLASGGNGEIYRASQQPFDREVVVKRGQSGRDERQKNKDLYVEGLVTGYLDHPKIVTVHEVAETEEGEPAVVMKKIVGRSLSEHRSNGERGEPFSVERLEEYLDAFVDVCHAVEFAHSHGIIHRDIKPENIMLGDFGDVYLIDWGLAAVAGDRDFDWEDVPSADATGFAGTPGFMAPEMVGDEFRELTFRTDQYLLGGLLHFLITGDPPHDGNSLGEALYRAFESDPKSYPEEVPRELAAILQRAMRREPGDRFSDVAAFREAVEQFFDHENSRRLTSRADEVADRIRRRLAQEETDEEAGEIFGMFGEARFGYRTAVEQWEGNTRARESFQELMELGVIWAVKTESPRAASMFLSEISDPPPDLNAKVQNLASQIDQRKTEGLFFEKSPNAVVVIDNEGTIQYVNRKLLEMFGYRAGELIDEELEILLPEQYHDGHVEHVQRYLKSPTARPMGMDLELAAQHSDGDEFPVDIELSPVESDEQTLVMAGIEQLEPREARGPTDASVTARAVLANLPQAVLAEADGEIEYANSRAAELLGVPGVSALLGDPLEDHLVRRSAEDPPPERGALIAADGTRHSVRLSDQTLELNNQSEVDIDVHLWIADPEGVD